MAFYRQHLGEHFSEGARLLWKALDREHLSFQQAATKLACDKGTLSRWLYGDVVLDLVSAARVKEEWPEILPELWTAKPKRPFAPPAARAEAS